MKVLITGASSGIGESLATVYAKKGAELVLLSRNIEELNRVKKICEKLGAKGLKLIPFDIANWDKIESLEIDDDIDVLINCAGISQRATAIDTEINVVKRIMDVNFMGVVALTKKVLPFMLRRKNGQIVIISSLVGKFGTPLRSSYSASKHALHGYFDSMRAEVEKNGIDVTVICPGFIKTNVSINAVTKDGGKHGKMDKVQANGMSSDIFAEKAVRVIEKKKREAWIGGKEIVMAYLSWLLPSLYKTVISKVKVT